MGVPVRFLHEEIFPATQKIAGVAGYIFNDDLDTELFYMHVETVKNPGIIAHEAIHLAYRLLEHVGVEIDADNHEALTYLVTWIMEKFYTIFGITSAKCDSRDPKAKDKKDKRVSKKKPIAKTESIQDGAWSGTKLSIG
jgi:hypothetical protein